MGNLENQIEINECEREYEQEYESNKKLIDSNRDLEFKVKEIKKQNKVFLFNGFFIMFTFLLVLFFFSKLSNLDSEREVKFNNQTIVSLKKDLQLNFIANKECLNEGENDLEIIASLMTNHVDVLVNNNCLLKLRDGTNKYFYYNGHNLANYKVNYNNGHISVTSSEK